MRGVIFSGLLLAAMGCASVARATGTARKSESVAQLVVPAPKGVDAGSNPARLTSHAQPRQLL